MACRRALLCDSIPGQLEFMTEDLAGQMLPCLDMNLKETISIICSYLMSEKEKEG